jgi:hypothetical protein
MKEEIKQWGRIRHKTSGELGIVTDLLYRCVNPTHILFSCLGRPQDCVNLLVGYKISTGFDTSYNVAKELVEPVPTEGKADA